MKKGIVAKSYILGILVSLGEFSLSIPSFAQGKQFTLIPQWTKKTKRELIVADIDGDGVVDRIRWGETYILPENMNGQAFWQYNLSPSFELAGAINVDGEPGDEICLARISKGTVLLDFLNYQRKSVLTDTLAIESLLIWGRDETRKWTPPGGLSKQLVGVLKTFAKADTLLSQAKDEFGNWNGSIRIEKCSSQLKGNSPINVIFSFITGFGLKPRGIGGYDSKTNEMIWYFPIATGVKNVEVGNLDNDNTQDIVAGGYSYGNGNVVNNMDDFHAYVVALNCEGKLLWKREVGECFCEALPRIIDVDSDGIDEVIVATEDRSAGGENNMLLILSGEKGKVITSKKLENLITGMGTGFLKDGGKIVISEADAYIRIFDESLREVKSYCHPAHITLVEVSDLNNDGSLEILAVAGDYKLLIFNGELDVVGEFEDNRISQNSRVTIIPSESKIFLEYSCDKEGCMYTMLKVKEIKTIDKVLPTISFDIPSKDTVIHERELIVKGKVYDNVGLDSIIVNGEMTKNIKEDTFHFEKNIQNLPLGNTSFYISAWDKSGNQSNKVLNIKREPYLPVDVWAVVVGISDYSDSMIPDLKYAHKDAKAFYDFLEERKKVGVFKDIHAKCLIDSEATLVDVRSALGKHTAKARLKDYVFIYFACHGFVDDIGTPYLMLSDSKINNIYATALPMSEIDRLLYDRIKSEKTVVIIDACRAGNIGSEVRGVPDLYTQLARSIERYKGKVFIAASRARQFSREEEGYKHGVFTYHLLNGLEGEADRDKDKIITLIELFDYLQEKVPPDSYDAQQPMLKGPYDERMILNVLQK